MAVVGYAAALAVSFVLAYLLRFDFGGDPNFPKYHSLVLQQAAWIIPLKLAILLAIGQFYGLLSYFSVPDLRRLLMGLAAGTAFPSAVWFYVNLSGRGVPDFLLLPGGVIAIDFFLSVLTISAFRLGCRLFRERQSSWSKTHASQRIVRVGIIGAGHVGASLARELSVRSGMGMRPLMFFDDDPRKWKTRVHDIPVVGSPQALLDAKLNGKLDKIIMAMPSAPAKRIGEIVRILQRANLPFETVPSMEQLAAGKVKVSQLRPVAIEDLLGREPVELETENIRAILRDRSVLVTGAGGSIGSELCRQIASFQPRILLLVEQSEGHLFEIEQELIDSGFGSLIVPVMADVLDMPRMHDIFERYQPQVVFHAAAHKHVPMMERHPTEAIKNNILGTVCVATMALEFKVERFVMVSTDKAINPTNVMGATKRLAEIFVQSLWASQPNGTKFMAVRFGNVLGSSGSVIPTFKKQIALGGPVKVTHPDITRYFMTIPEAVGLVLQCGAQGTGGEIFVLDMGEPVKIVDLARQVIELSGLRPGEDIEIQFTGLRPGEKLFEELSYKGENILPTTHPKILRFASQPRPLEQLQQELQVLFANVQDIEPNELKLTLKRLIPEYRPYLAEAANSAAPAAPAPATAAQVA
ncbi:MAG: polysaccharide biosynthesis protein [Verrucomicrobia bacterium]|nr:polysaccharide biosynthesis protein [Verrucomicrobiota bacterium]